MFLEDSTIEVFAVLMVEVFAWRKVSVTTSFIYVCIFKIYGRVIHITMCAWFASLERACIERHDRSVVFLLPGNLGACFNALLKII